MRTFVLLLTLALGACTLGGTGGPKPAPANPITGGEVAVTALAPPPGAAGPAASPAATAPAPSPAAAGPGGAPPAVAPNAPKPADAPATAATPAAPAAAGSVKVDIPPASPEEAACRKKGGTWATVGKAGRACVRYTRDAGKSCRRGTQCEGLCLARSGTCAPVAPLFGCNDILQDNGTRATLCID